MKKGIFITATDTGVGKTVATSVLGVLLKQKGFKVGVMKPVQCAGNDAQLLKNILAAEDSLAEINPYYLKEPLSPHLAFKRSKITPDINKIKSAYERLAQKYDIVLVEGAGGLLVPIKPDYLMADLARDLNLEVIIVSRLGLGAINHSLLTINQAREYCLKVCGIIFNQNSGRRHGVPEKTNPAVIQRLGKVEVLGTIPYLGKIKNANAIKKCSGKIKVGKLLAGKIPAETGRLEQLDKEYLWHPFTQMQDWLKEKPLVIERGEGNYLIDTEGKKYLDGISSLWVNVHGHRNKIIDQALKEQVNKISHSTLLGLSNVPAIELAQKLIKIAPKGLTKVFYSDSGSTAVEIAIKIAYQYWQNIGEKKKTAIAHLANSYHGDTLGSVSVGGIDLFHKVYRKLIFKTIKIDFPDCYRAPKGKKYPDYAFECVAEMENLFKTKGGTIAALIVEPIVQGAAGMIVWPKGVLKKMEEVCRKYNVLLIADEVATGFGRTGKMFACEHENVHPDILCLAKGITGGYLPLAATLTSERIYKGFLFDYKERKTFFHGHTFTGNPLACAAALANIKIFEEEKVLQKLQPKIRYFHGKLQEFYRLKHVGDVRSKGLMAGIELVRDNKTMAPFAWTEKIGVKVCAAARNYGVILRPLGNVIVLMPPLSVSFSELEKLLDVTYKCIKEVAV